MLRGFRWQFVALIISIVIFGLALINRFTTAPAPVPPTAMPSAPTAIITEPPTIAAEPTQPIAATPAPLADNTQTDVMTFREGIVGNVNRLNPLFATDTERDITSLIFDGLTSINEYGEPVGNLAADWVVSRDGLEYVFQLKTDILWQDGTPFNADDVIFTFDILRSDDYPNEPRRDFWQTVEVQKLSESLVRFRLAQPLASFPAQLTTGILPYHALQGTTAGELAQHPFNLTPVGTGAYQLEALRSADGERITAVDLRVSPVYRQRTDAPYAIERLRFKIYDTFDQALVAFENGAIDGLAATDMTNRPALVALPNTRISTSMQPTLGTLIFNWDEGENVSFFSEQRVRSALQLGLNRQTAVERPLNNQAVLANSPLPYNSWAHDPSVTVPGKDPARAQAFLNNAPVQLPAEATAEPDANDDTIRYAFSILVRDTPALRQLADDVAAQWGALGLDVRVEAVDEATLQQRLEDGDFKTAVVELPLRNDPDAYPYWHSSQFPDGLNYGSVVDTRIDELLERARREANGINRDQLYDTFQRQFIDRAIAIPLYYPLFTYAVDNDVRNVRLGYIGNPSHRFRTLGTWQMTDS